MWPVGTCIPVGVLIWYYIVCQALPTHVSLIDKISIARKRELVHGVGLFGFLGESYFKIIKTCCQHSVAIICIYALHGIHWVAVNCWIPTVCTLHYDDVMMGAIASQITSLTIVYSTVHSGADQRKHQSSASLAFVRGIHRGPVNSPHKWPVTRKMFPFDDVIMCVTIFQTIVDKLYVR